MSGGCLQLAALIVGAGVPERDFSGRIAEIYPHACLIELTDGELLTLVAKATGALPCGITLDAAPGFAFPAALVRTWLAARGGVLRARDGAFTVDLRGARVWRSDLGALRIDIAEPSARAAWRAAWVMSRRDGRAGQLRQIGAAPIRGLIAATFREDARLAASAASRLIGLGEGSTPAGDDYLVGYVAGLQALAARGDFTGQFRAALQGMSARANRVSRLYVAAAARGEISERLYTVAAAIAAGAHQDIHAPLAKALEMGHSSGAAGVLGLLHACAAGHSRARAYARAEAPSGGSASAWAIAGCSRHATARQIAPNSA